MAVHFRGDGCGVGAGTAVALQKPSEIGEPHSRRHTFAGDVSVGDKHPGTILRKSDEVAGQKARGEDFAGKLQFALSQEARAAQLALDLCGFEKLCVKVERFTVKGINLILQRLP